MIPRSASNTPLSRSGVDVSRRLLARSVSVPGSTRSVFRSSQVTYTQQSYVPSPWAGSYDSCLYGLRGPLNIGSPAAAVLCNVSRRLFSSPTVSGEARSNLSSLPLPIPQV
jgi:hypothetical protein